MIDMHPKYDNMNKTGMVYTLICINNHIIIIIHYMLSPSLLSRVHDREIFHHDTSLSPLLGSKARQAFQNFDQNIDCNKRCCIKIFKKVEALRIDDLTIYSR